MALERKDRVKDQTATTGTGTVTIDGVAPTGYRTIAAAHTTGSTVRYVVTNSSGSEWEVGEGVWTSATNTLTRVTVYASSNAGSLVSFSAGTKTVFTGPVGQDFAEFAPLASPTFTGVPAAPTAAADTNTTQVATTAYVVGQSYLKSATASTTYAPLASPALTGTPTAPTAAAATNTTQLATTAHVFAERTNSATLTNKTLTAPIISTISNTGTLTLPTSTDTLVGKATTDTLTNKTLTDPVIVGAILEDIFTITDGAAFEIDPSNGTIQLITLGASRTPKGTNFAAGESVTLMIDDGTAYAITWTDTTFGTSGVKWIGGSAPTLATTGYTVIELWKVSTQVYGAYVGAA